MMIKIITVQFPPGRKLISGYDAIKFALWLLQALRAVGLFRLGVDDGDDDDYDTYGWLMVTDDWRGRAQ